jgi:hypothetical protein
LERRHTGRNDGAGSTQSPYLHEMLLEDLPPEIFAEIVQAFVSTFGKKGVVKYRLVSRECLVACAMTIVADFSRSVQLFYNGQLAQYRG